MQDQPSPTEVPQTQQVQIGFEKALTMMNPEWRAQFTKEQVNQFRHFYHQGIQDVYFLVRLQNEQMAQNFQSVLNTVVVTGNEEEIAAAQAEAQKAINEDSPMQTETKKDQAKPKAAKKAVKKGRK